MDQNGIEDVVINDRKTQCIAQAFFHCQRGMLFTEAQAGAQLIAPGRRIHIFIEFIIQVAFHTMLFQSANRTTGFAASFQQIVDNRIRQQSVDPFEVKSK